MVNPIVPRTFSGSLLSPEKTPEEALISLRRCFDELAKHQKFIAVAWNKQYDTRQDSEWIRDPVNVGMRGSVSQAYVMVKMVENNLQLIERHLKATFATSTEARHA